MNKLLKGGIALVLALLICLSAASCAADKKTPLDLSKFPLVFADKNGLEALSQGEEEPTLITKDFYTFLNADSKVQAASDGRIYYVATKDKLSGIGELYAYDVEKKESELIHENVYNFKVSNDGETIIICDGSGGILKYNKKHEKKGDYPYIQKSGVSNVLDISADGKYVLYTQVLKATNYYTLTIAETGFEAPEESEKLTVEQRRENKNLSKGPVFIAENFLNYIGAADNLSVIYYEQKAPVKDDPHLLCAFKNFKENAVLSKVENTTYFVSSAGEMLFSQKQQGALQRSDIITDKYEKKDAKLKKKSATKKQWQDKTRRDNTREKIDTYLENISTINFYQYSKDSKSVQKVISLNGNFTEKGVDKQLGFAFFGATIYDFSKSKKPDINKVSIAYKLFDEIRSRAFFNVSLKGMEVLEIEQKEDSEYNAGDVYVDTSSKRILIVMDFDYSKQKSGILYTAAYDEEGFGTTKHIADKVTKVAHFDCAEDVYFVTSNGSLVLNNSKNVVLKDYAYSVTGGEAPIAFTSIGTGKKDDYGNEIMEDTAYLIKGKEAQKIGTLFTQKNIVAKGDMFAAYTDYDFKTQSGKMLVYNGQKLIKFDSEVSYVYRFA